MVERAKEIQERLEEYRRSKKIAQLLGSWVVSGFILLVAFGALLYAVGRLAELLGSF
jgi:hypothetical protein